MSKHPTDAVRQGDDDRLANREDRRTDPRWWSAASPHGTVAAAHYRATAAGLEMLENGGNAIDAAVATAFALAVCEPAGSGLGGMCVMLVHDARSARTVTIEGSCRAPRRATPDAVAESDRYRGHRAAAVPTHVAALAHALRRFGTLPESVVLQPALRLAEQGFLWTAMQHRVAMLYLDALRAGSAATLLLDDRGDPLPPGHWLRQPALARTLRGLAERGLSDFYVGEIARSIDADMRRHGGFVGADDLAELPPLRESEPLEVPLRDGVLQTLGPPGGGLALAQLALLWDAVAGPDADLDDPRAVVLLARAIRRTRRDRRRFRRAVAADAVAGAAPLLEPAYAAEAAAQIHAELRAGGGGANGGAAPSRAPRPGSAETSHLSVADRHGNVVAMTQSLERSFGAAELSPALGFLYNGYLRAFKVRATDHPHFLRPGAVARSNAAPTIVLRGGRAVAAIGSTGSERMASGIFETLVRLRSGTPFEAVHAPRLHATPGRRVLGELCRLPSGCVDALVAHGLCVDDLGEYAFSMGGLQLAARVDDAWVGVADPRRDGAAACPDR